ncbi:DUF134 domain-containing protein [Shewanella sp. SR43-4]|jgi:predicted DNA-binding protein (UPF0251 family)|uniref:UPF0251 protein ABHN84_04365 n=1 Tax=Shewanella vesiculosa TaxID=518738 RepID=A0ABV0FPH5_9GAMM|nr:MULTISPECIES: DUF134 domain-containing protein [Shewanella]NCQ44351.1 DUF134 domain-containing protein [Shewanella frigidimarina]MBB1319132.1 DUF134 domain-containing protein [Shewanella sp. SR43-4]MBB1389607.1 DUF134 domain-containing protein [Shewanella sp. SG44-6]MBB1475689.1 DUF134 domain-containing protein [Shewanella sp. SG41-3]NCO71691.1 DUF134 domain-containing protein [Shewanella vesiculosa]|tara:strand:- start:240 stop:524 length:285 start_codon:yes stop_codon:yes gene_type:complete
MARPKIPRTICGQLANICFKPNGIPMVQLEQVPLAEDEIEALRLVDLLGMQQQEAAKSMGISRQTLANLVKGARYKVVDSLIYGKALMTNISTK